MDDFIGWGVAIMIAGTIWFAFDGCENKSKEQKKEEPVYLQWEPAPASQSSYTSSQSTHTTPSNTSYNNDWKPVITEPEPEPEYTYSYSYSTSFNNSSNDYYENWETEDIEGFYVKLDNCKSDEQAEYISDQYYTGEYIEEGWDYYAKTSVNSGIYEIELDDRINSKMFKIRGTDCYIRFKWSTSLWRWDEGVMDVWNSRGTFYIKPD